MEMATRPAFRRPRLVESRDEFLTCNQNLHPFEESSERSQADHLLLSNAGYGERVQGEKSGARRSA